ncbi:glycosyltransferase [Alkalibacillus silvisoli]|uniref:Glycosyltransferase n=1 Tax=Alkalibacillus silvisoli TaxID=392823 RepID=A0ABN1A722_9BACI
MKIAFVSSGNSIHVKKLANGLVKHGHSVTLYTLPNHNKLTSDFDKKVKLVYLPFGGKLGYYLNALKLKKLLLKGNYDIVNCHYVSGYGTLARLANIQPIVTSVFGSDVYEYPFKSKSNMNRIIKNLDSAKVITSTSEVMANKVREFYKTKDPIYVTHFGIDLKLFKPTETTANKEEKSFTFGIIKKLEDRYGFELLFKAFAKFLESLEDKSNCKLLIYGRGSREEYYKTLVKELNIAEYVHFKGFIQNELVPTAMNEIDVVCIPSYNESFGVAAVEAMACGKPLIVSDASGFTEVVENKTCGFIVPRGDLEELVSKMKICYGMNKHDLKNMGLNGYQRAQDMFNFDKNIVTYIDAISQALKNER